MPASRERSTLIIVSLALFMVVLDNLVVSVALREHPPRLRLLGPVARVDGQRLHARPTPCSC